MDSIHETDTTDTTDTTEHEKVVHERSNSGIQPEHNNNVSEDLPTPRVSKSDCQITAIIEEFRRKEVQRTQDMRQQTVQTVRCVKHGEFRKHIQSVSMDFRFFIHSRRIRA